MKCVSIAFGHTVSKSSSAAFEELVGALVGEVGHDVATKEFWFPNDGRLYKGRLFLEDFTIDEKDRVGYFILVVRGREDSSRHLVYTSLFL